MTNDQYLRSVLDAQSLTDREIQNLRNQRDIIQGQLSVLQGNPRFYYAGSYAKGTMIRQKYDLDIVMYWPSSVTYTLKGIFDAVGKTLRSNHQYVNQKTVAWELPFRGDFHIDVVPGKAQDATYYDATLYKSDVGSTLQTSLKTHIDAVKNSGRQDVIRLMKLWKVRRRVPFKSFVLELMTIQGCRGTSLSELERPLVNALVYVRDNILAARVVDPANSNNIISESITAAEKQAIQQLARAAIDAKTWSEVFS